MREAMSWVVVVVVIVVVMVDVVDVVVDVVVVDVVVVDVVVVVVVGGGSNTGSSTKSLNVDESCSDAASTSSRSNTLLRESARSNSSCISSEF